MNSVAARVADQELRQMRSMITKANASAAWNSLSAFAQQDLANAIKNRNPRALWDWLNRYLPFDHANLESYRHKVMPPQWYVQNGRADCKGQALTLAALTGIFHWHPDFVIVGEASNHCFEHIVPRYSGFIVDGSSRAFGEVGTPGQVCLGRIAEAL